MARSTHLKNTAMFRPDCDTWRWKCYFTNLDSVKIGESLAHVLMVTGIHCVPDDTQFLRIIRNDVCITYRDFNSYISIQINPLKLD